MKNKNLQELLEEKESLIDLINYAEMFGDSVTINSITYTKQELLERLQRTNSEIELLRQNNLRLIKPN